MRESVFFAHFNIATEDVATMKESTDGRKLSDPNYWNNRYANADGHEWFKTFAALEPFLKRHLLTKPNDSRILHLGSGDSTIPVDLAKLGYHNQLCVDFSQVVVDMMNTPNARDLGIEWQQADVRNLNILHDSSIDIAFDKGTLDAMIYGSPWDPPDDVKENTRKYMDEVVRVLKDDGVFLYITFRQPHFVKPLLNYREQWKMEMEVLQDEGGGFDYYAFVLHKADGQAMEGR
jgi:SAM-dependent methyltransferase